jgi:hypothetical protein
MYFCRPRPAASKCLARPFIGSLGAVGRIPAKHETISAFVPGAPQPACRRRRTVQRSAAREPPTAGPPVQLRGARPADCTVRHWPRTRTHTRLSGVMLLFARVRCIRWVKHADV